MTWIKICGTTNVEDAQVAIAAGADALGFIFAASPRKIAPQRAREIICQLPQGVEKIGVFVDEKPQRILEVAQEVGLTGIQLHGNEPPLTVRALRNGSTGEQLKIVKAVRMLDVNPQAVFASLGNDRKLRPDVFLLDSGAAEKRGGSGQAFNWSQWAGFAHRLAELVPVAIAGGLNPSNVTEALRVLAPWGVDVVSGVEQVPGKKDSEKVRAFISAVRMADKL